jgi:hypothetical protein
MEHAELETCSKMEKLFLLCDLHVLSLFLVATKLVFVTKFRQYCGCNSKRT